VRVLLLADEIFATRERTMLVRLEVGLADEGVRVIHAVPRRAAARAEEIASPGVFTTPVHYEDVGLPLTRGVRASRLVDAAGVKPGDDASAVDIVHVFGGSAWEIGREVAQRCGAALVLEVWRAGLAPRARAFAEQHRGLPTLLIAPDPNVERAILANGPGPLVRVAPWGVHASPEPPLKRTAERPPFLALVGAGRDRRSFNAALEGVAGLLAAHPALMVVADASSVRAAGAWALARKSSLLPALSLLDDLEGRREMVLHADVFLCPEALGEQRSLLLDAMGLGRVVLAASDPAISWLVDGATCRLVPRGDAAAWQRAIQMTLDVPVDAHALGLSAQRFVRDHARASDHVAAVIAAYQWLSSNDSIPLSRETSAS
jgi:glycosyltransferase involved in cell wall biosynthesis